MVLRMPIRKISSEYRTPQTPTYIIWSDKNGTYYAKNTYTGELTSSQNVAHLIKSAAEIIKSKYSGGKIFLKSGQYVISEAVDLGEGDLNLVIEGEDMWSTVLTLQSDIPVFRAVATRPNSGVRMLTVRNLTIRGSGQGQGIVLGATQRGVLQFAALVTIEKVFFDRLKQAIYANNLWIGKIIDVVTNSGVPGGPPVIQFDENGADTSHDIYIVRLYAEGFKSRLISLPPRSYDITIDQAFIDAHNEADYLIYMDPSSHYNAVLNSYLAGATRYAVHASPGSKIKGNLIWYTARGVYGMGAIIEGNNFTEISEEAVHLSVPVEPPNIVKENSIMNAKYGVISETDHAVIETNRLYNIAKQAIIVRYRTGNIIRGNAIYVVGGPSVIEITGQYHIIADNHINSELSTYAVDEPDGDNNVIDRNMIISPVNIRKTGPNTYIGNNHRYITRNSGRMVIPTNSRSATVNHRLACTPQKILVTPLAQPPGPIWVSNINNTSFQINVSTAPTADLPVAWYAEC